MSPITLREHRDLFARARAALEMPVDLDDTARATLILDLAAAEAVADFAGTRVEVALIDSGGGTQFYVATSDAALTRQLAGWCRPRWDRTGDPRDPAALDDETIVATYFAGDVSEYFAIGSVRIVSDDATIEQGRYCVVSTAHVSHATSEWLERWSAGPPPPSPLPIAPTFYGWFVSTSEPEVPADPLPDDLLAAMRFGRKRGFDQILFDCDAAQVEGLAIHDW